MSKKILIEVSARHCHLCQADLEKLFGKGYELKKLRALSQPGLFAAEESIAIKNGKMGFGKVRVIGPERDYTQIEISKTDAIFLGVEVPLKKSGDIEGTPGITLAGPAGEVVLKKGLIIPKRHIHCSEQEAQGLGVKDGDMVSVEVKGERGIIFNNVKVRVGDKFKMSMHIDTDEGNAAGISKGAEGELVK